MDGDGCGPSPTLRVQAAAPASSSGAAADGTSSEDAWVSHHSFVSHERQQQQRNRLAWLQRSGEVSTNPLSATLADVPCGLFISHSWESSEGTQLCKRRLITEVSSQKGREGPQGFVYWADYLHLGATGAVPWCPEIGDGIRQSAKTVCFIDGSYLHSFRCLQELATAFQHGKPIVPVILDQDAWSYLTTTSGADRAWTEAGLSSYEGQTLTEDDTFSLQTLKDVFYKLSAINFCPCRALDQEGMGEDGMIANFCQYVNKDIPYLKEHADLLSRAVEWEKEGKPSSSLLHGDDIEKWSMWYKRAVKAGTQPVPSPLQTLFIQRSRRRREAIHYSLFGALALVLVAILVGASISAVMYVNANAAAQHAQKQQMISTVLLLGNHFYPDTSREMRALVRAGELAEEHNVRQAAIPSIQAALHHVNTKPYRFYELGQDGAHLGWVRSVGVSPDGLRVASGSQDGTVKVWHVGAPGEGRDVPSEFASVATLTCPSVDVYRSIAWSPDGKLLAAGSLLGQICLWYVESGQPTTNDIPLVLEGHSADVWDMQFNPNMDEWGYVLASGCDDNTFRLWGLDVSSAESRLIGAELYVTQPSFDNTEDWISWESQSVKKGDIRGLAWTSDGAMLAAGNKESFVSVYTLNKALQGHPDLLLLHTFVVPIKDLRSLTISPHAETPWVVVAGKETEELDFEGCPIAVFNLHEVLASAELAPDPTFVLLGHADEPRKMAWLDAGARMVSVDAGGMVGVWDVPPAGSSATLSKLQQISPWLFMPSVGRVLNSVSSAGSRVAVGSDSGDIGILEFNFTEPSPDVQATHVLDCNGSTTAGKWSRQGDRAAAGTPDGRVCFFATESKVHLVADLEMAASDAASEVTLLAWSPDGEYLASTNAGSELTLWTWPKGSSAPSPAENLALVHIVVALEFSTDSTRLGIVGTQDMVQVFDTSTSSPSLLWQWQGSRHLGHLAWGPGHVLAVTGADELYIWPEVGGIAAGGLYNPVHSLAGEGGPVAFSPDGHYLASTNAQSIHLWHSGSGFASTGSADALKSSAVLLQSHRGPVTDLDFDDDSQWLVSTSWTDGSVRLWELAGSAALQSGGSSWHLTDLHCSAIQHLGTGHVMCTSETPEDDGLAGRIMVQGTRYTVDFSMMLSELSKMAYGHLSDYDLDVYGYSFLMKDNSTLVL